MIFCSQYLKAPNLSLTQHLRVSRWLWAYCVLSCVSLWSKVPCGHGLHIRPAWTQRWGHSAWPRTAQETPALCVPRLELGSSASGAGNQGESDWKWEHEDTAWRTQEWGGKTLAMDIMLLSGKTSGWWRLIVTLSLCSRETKSVNPGLQRDVDRVSITPEKVGRR